MDPSRGYDLPPSAQARLRILDWIGDNGGTTPGASVSLGPLFEGRDENAANALAEHLQSFEDSDLLRLQKTFDWGSWFCNVTSAGASMIEDLRHERGDLLGRRKAARDAFLAWLHDCTLRGDAHPVSSEFPRSTFGNYFGHAFTDEEIEAAADWLKEEGYIAGSGVFGGGIPRPSITTKGERVVERGRSVNDDAPEAANAPTTITHITGSNNVVAANSPGTVQTVTVTMTEDNRRQLGMVADNLDGLLKAGLLGLDEERTAQAETIVADLRRTQEEPSASSGTIRQLLEKAKVVAISGTGAALGNGVVALADQALHALGLG